MDNSKVVNKLEHLKTLPAISFMDDEMVRGNFISLYKNTHPNESDTQAETFYEREALFLKRILIANPKLQTATIFSLYCCFIDVVTNGMTFEPAMGLMYIETRGFNVAPYGKTAVWETRAGNKLTATGELNLRMQLNQLKYADAPVIVYDGEVFRMGVGADKKKYVVYEMQLPRKSKKIIGSFMGMTRPDGSVDYVVLTEDDIDRFKASSLKENTRYNKDAGANELYTSCNGGIDPAFLATKTMRHAFKAFPKARILGSNTTLASEETIDEANMVVDRGNVSELAGPGSVIEVPVGTPVTYSQDPNNGTPQTVVQEITKIPGGGIQIHDINF